jgi:hypothetical protein
VNRPRWTIALLVILTIGVSMFYLGAAFGIRPGQPIAPLDDAYITFQYARQIARGHPYRYNDGDPPTTGMTSPLFGFLLAGAHLLGFRGDGLVGLAVALGVVWLVLVAWLTHRFTSRLLAKRAHHGWPLLAAALVLLAGPFQWAAFNGMETGLFTVLTLAALDTFLAGRVGWCTLWLGLASLTRPEGVILAGLVWGVTLGRSLLASRSVPWRALALLSLAVGAGLIPSLVNRVLTGTTAAAGLQAKSWWLNVPAYPDAILRSTFLSYVRVMEGFLKGWGFASLSPFPSGLLLFALAGWIALGVRRRWAELALTAGWFFAGSLVAATLITVTWHIGRYQAPFVPVAIGLAVCGLAFVSRRLAPRHRFIPLSLALLLVVSAVLTVPPAVRIYRAAVRTVIDQQLAVATWIRENLPAGARVGVHDTGSLRYVGERPTYDVIGLTTAGAAIPWRHGAGSVYEHMEHSPMRPDYFAIYPDVFSIPYLAATDLFAEELFRVNVPDHRVASAGPVQGIWRADWRLAGSGQRFYQPDVLSRTTGLRVVDRLDVADLADEAAHDLVWWQDAQRTGFPTEVWQLSYPMLPDREVLDGGRLLTGGMTFDLTARPGEDLWLVARLHAQQGGAVEVLVNGERVGRWAYPPVAGRWLETLFHVPSTHVTTTRTQITLRVVSEGADFRHYAPYFLWALQGEPEEVAVEIEHPLHADFDAGLTLLGYDLPGQVFHPGDVLPVTLYWRATRPVEVDAKVFLHLYTEGGELGPQSDGWAYHGTRPPYTWAPGEIVADPHFISLPADLPPGRYSLEAGLYYVDGSGRLQAMLDGVVQVEGRVPLTIVEVHE